MKKLLFGGILALLLICVVSLLACTSTTSPTSSITSTPPQTSTSAASTTPASTTPAAATPKFGGTLRIGDSSSPVNAGWTADPIFGIGGPFQTVFFDTIIKEDVQGNIRQNLATQWEVSPDQKSLTLTFRKGVKFHDGSDFNATVAKWNIDILIAAKNSNYTTVSSVDVVDDYTIRLNMSKWANTIYDALAQTFIISKAAYDKNGEDYMRKNSVGTGPFKFSSWEPNVSIKGVRFDDYWGGKPYLDAIEINTIIDPTTRANAFEAKDQDIIGGDLSKAEYDLKQKGFEVLNGYISVYCLIPDSKNADSPYANVKVRQAVSYAIDRDAIVKSLGYGWWSSVNQFALPGSTAYISSIPANPYSQDKAQQLMTEAGYPTGFTSSIIVDTFVSNKDAVTAMQGFLSKIGIKVDLNMADMGTSMTYMTQGWHNALFGAARAGIIGNINSGLANWTPDSPWHSSLLKTPEFIQLYTDSLTAKQYDPALAKKAVQYLYDNTTIIPIYAVSRGDVLQPYVHDTGFYTQNNFWYWTPSKTWMSK
jgi:peptide/nickel transport system substrate-binding protein